LLPLITIPYLARTLNPTGYGTMIYALSISSFLGSICDYGFGWTATRDIAAYRDDMARVGRIFSGVLASKLFIFLLCIVPFLIVAAVAPGMKAHYEIFAVAMIGVVGSVIFPTWLFQGMNRLAVLAWLSLAGRAISVTSIFLLVHHTDDVLLAVFLQVSSSLIVGVVALFVARQWIGKNLSVPSFPEILAQLKDAWLVFASTLSINLYTSAQTILVGSFGGPVSAAYYASAEKCLSAAKMGFGIMGQAAMPHVGYLVQNDHDEGLKFIRRLLLTFPVGLTASIIMFYFAEPLVQILFGQAYVAGVVPVFKIMSPIPLILNLSTCLASLYMFHYGFQKQWSFMLFMACMISFATFLALRLVLKVEQAAAVAVLTAEVFVLLVSGAYYFRNALKTSAAAE
jgi:polysaccharide transporter, PST family